LWGDIVEKTFIEVYNDYKVSLNSFVDKFSSIYGINQLLRFISEHKILYKQDKIIVGFYSNRYMDISEQNKPFIYTSLNFVFKPSTNSTPIIEKNVELMTMLDAKVEFDTITEFIKENFTNYKTFLENIKTLVDSTNIQNFVKF